MIKINLLPVKKVRKRAVGQKQLVVFLLIYVALVAVLFLLYAQKRGELVALRNESMQIEKEIAKNKQYLKNLEEYKRRERELKQKLEVIKQLRQKKETPVPYLETIAKLIPKKVWLDEFTLKAGFVTMKGYSSEYQSVANFMAALEQSQKFKNVVLASITRHPVKMPMMASAQVLEFVITCQVVKEKKEKS